MSAFLASALEILVKEATGHFISEVDKSLRIRNITSNDLVLELKNRRDGCPESIPFTCSEIGEELLRRLRHG
jgi:hypothetical protein